MDPVHERGSMDPVHILMDPVHGPGPRRGSMDQAPVVQRMDNAIHRINHYPADSVVRFVNTYPLDSDLSGG